MEEYERELKQNFKRIIAPFRKFMFKLSKDLTIEDLEALKIFSEISRSDMEKISTPLELFNKLEQLDIIGVDGKSAYTQLELNLSWLTVYLEEMKKHRLVEEIVKFESKYNTNIQSSKGMFNIYYFFLKWNVHIYLQIYNRSRLTTDLGTT